MVRSRFVVVAVAAAAAFAAAAGMWGRYRPSDVVHPIAQLQGVWFIASVHKDGAADPAQIGATVTFAGDAVRFQPVVVVADWTG